MTMPHMDAGTTNTTEGSSSKPGKPGRAPQDHRKSQRETRLDEAATIADLVRQDREDGDELTGPGGLLKRVTKMVLETALEEEMTDSPLHFVLGGTPTSVMRSTRPPRPRRKAQEAPRATPTVSPAPRSRRC